MPWQPEGLRNAVVPSGLWDIGGRRPGIEMPGSTPKPLRAGRHARGAKTLRSMPEPRRGSALAGIGSQVALLVSSEWTIIVASHQDLG